MYIAGNHVIISFGINRFVQDTMTTCTCLPEQQTQVKKWLLIIMSPPGKASKQWISNSKLAKAMFTGIETDFWDSCLDCIALVSLFVTYIDMWRNKVSLQAEQNKEYKQPVPGECIPVWNNEEACGNYSITKSYWDICYRKLDNSTGTLYLNLSNN